jgi:hypothetical protein
LLQANLIEATLGTSPGLADLGGPLLRLNALALKGPVLGQQLLDLLSARELSLETDCAAAIAVLDTGARTSGVRCTPGGGSPRRSCTAGTRASVRAVKFGLQSDIIQRQDLRSSLV